MSKNSSAIRELELTGPSGTATEDRRPPRRLPTQDQIVSSMLNPGQSTVTAYRQSWLTRLIARLQAVI